MNTIDFGTTSTGMLVKKYVREDKKISYNELGESMRNKKIKIKKGQLNFHIMMVLQ